MSVFLNLPRTDGRTHTGIKVHYNMSLLMRKPAFSKSENKDANQLISAFVFASRIVQSLFFPDPKFQASSHFPWLYSPVCVDPGRKPRRPVFSQRGSYCSIGGAYICCTAPNIALSICCGSIIYIYMSIKKLKNSVLNHI